jgi:hypothetical protein
MKLQQRGDDPTAIVIRTDLPGPQRLFMRESEAAFYDRIRQETKNDRGAVPAIFPEEIPISKEKYQLSYPRVDPITRAPFPHAPLEVEPSFVCHRRLLFEQPNFERIGYNFGVVQPFLHVTTFYYDMVLLPYHLWSDFSHRAECNIGKCLPGDPAPFTVPIERFSVTGIIGEAGAIIAAAYLLPHH